MLLHEFGIEMQGRCGWKIECLAEKRSECSSNLHGLPGSDELLLERSCVRSSDVSVRVRLGRQRVRYRRFIHLPLTWHGTFTFVVLRLGKIFCKKEDSFRFENNARNLFWESRHAAVFFLSSASSLSSGWCLRNRRLNIDNFLTSVLVRETRNRDEHIN